VPAVLKEMLPVGEPVPEVALTPVVGEMLQLELEILDPERVKLVALPSLMLLPALLATAKLLGVGQVGCVPLKLQSVQALLA